MVLSRCWATSVSTVGTPVMSMMAIMAPVSTIFCSRLSITTWVRALSSVPISGSASTFCHSCTTGVDSSSSSCCWRRMTCSRAFWCTSMVYRPSLSNSELVAAISLASWAAAHSRMLRRWSNKGSFRANTKLAVSSGEKPCSAYARLHWQVAHIGPVVAIGVGAGAAFHGACQQAEELFGLAADLEFTALFLAARIWK
jgi:hypothetical protein